MARIQQELHCPKSGGGCGGYFIFKLTTGYDRKVIVVCPKCHHEHTRCVQNGQVVEEGRYNGNKTNEYLRPTIAAWTEKPRTVEIPGRPRKERTSFIIENPEKELLPVGEELAMTFLRQSWIEYSNLD